MEQTLNPTVRFVDLTIKGETYKLALDFNAIAEAEPACGVNLFQALDWGNANAAQWRGILWAAMLKAQPTTTLRQAGVLVNTLLFEKDGLTKLRDALAATFAASNPDPDPQQPEQVKTEN